MIPTPYPLSKSRYCSAVQCPKMLWLKKNRPEVFDFGVLNESTLETGSQVGDLAMGLFGDFVEVPYGDLGEMVETTKELLAHGTPVIAEASFSVGGLFCSVDILKNLGGGNVELYEVKSSTGVHEIYYHDVAFQAHILTLCGLTAQKCFVVHINKQYERQGELDVHGLFSLEEITERVRQMQEEVAERTAAVREYMKREDEPSDDIGAHCFTPYACGFFGYCTRHLPERNVFQIAGLRKSTQFKCYWDGIVSFDELYASDRLSYAQRKQIEHELFPQPPQIEAEPIREFMSGISYPLYFLDFESFQPAIPLFDRSHPFEQIVFQYSLHYIEREGGQLQHKEFLAYPGQDPRRALAEQLCADIPLDVCTTAYNMGFEKGRIRKLADLYPDLREHLLNIHDHIRDLMIPFQKKWYYCRAMQGSYSIKYVLPALFPDDPSLDYHNLEGVHNGGEASDTFARMASMSPEELETARANLLRYCGLDTFAMVKVWEKLKSI